jgi:hypothetical protein
MAALIGLTVTLGCKKRIVTQPQRIMKRTLPCKSRMPPSRGLVIRTPMDYRKSGQPLQRSLENSDEVHDYIGRRNWNKMCLERDVLNQMNHSCPLKAHSNGFSSRA